VRGNLAARECAQATLKRVKVASIGRNADLNIFSGGGPRVVYLVAYALDRFASFGGTALGTVANVGKRPLDALGLTFGVFKVAL
jgi:hypothetical protein